MKTIHSGFSYSRFGFCVLSVWAIGSLAGLTAKADEFAFFESKIRPVLVEHCYECHSAKSKPIRAGLRVDSRVAIRRGGESGAAVAPGDTESSLLLSALRHESFEMPPAGRLPDRVIRDFETWIAAGAKDPRNESAPATRVPRADASHWSYRPVDPSPPPQVSNTAWPTNDIDRYILHRLESAGLAPGGDAAPLELLRRLSFDLIGLPPTLEQVRRFEAADFSRDEYVALVDELLASPAFGEKWARHWLDVVRFAESTGGGRTRIFDSAWRYRDYVIQSLNDDKPFSRFAQEHIAGDLLEHDGIQSAKEGLIATGFLVLGPINYELQDKELLRMEVIDEQLDVIGRAFLGMSIGCARCHDHKFDPLSTAEYYSLAGIFRSTKSLTPGNVSGFVMRPLPLPEAVETERAETESKLKPLEQKLAAIETELKKLAPAKPAAQRIDPQSLEGIVIDDPLAKKIGNWTASTSIPGYIGESYIHDASEQRGMKRVVYETKLPVDGIWEVRVSYTASANRASNALVQVHHQDGVGEQRVNQRRPPVLAGSFATLGKFKFSTDIPARVIIENAGADGVVIADCVQWIPEKPLPNLTARNDSKSRKDAKGNDEKKIEEQSRLKTVARLEAEKVELLDQIKPLRARLPKSTMVMSVSEDAEPGDFAVCIRGDVHQLGETVARGFPAALGDPIATIPNGASGRRQLAEWLTNSSNPRTSRVIVNRVWSHLFGEGLVRTTDDLGSTGEKPSHPRLLDHLAGEFVEDDWSLKRLIRRMALSRTYRLSTQASASLLKTDPENRLLGRRSHRRLPAESIRDATLLVSGELDTMRGGKTLKPNTKSEFGYAFDNVRNRRSVYIPVLRNTLHDFLAVFDVADPNLVNGRRNASTLPTQSLFLMNSPEIWRLSQSAARRLLEEPYATDSDRVDAAFRRFLSRPPSDRERELTGEFLTQSKDRSLQWAKFCQSLFASVDFRFSP